jgi:hypothetical protein
MEALVAYCHKRARAYLHVRQRDGVVFRDGDEAAGALAFEALRTLFQPDGSGRFTKLQERLELISAPTAGRYQTVESRLRRAVLKAVRETLQERYRRADPPFSHIEATLRTQAERHPAIQRISHGMLQFGPGGPDVVAPQEVLRRQVAVCIGEASDLKAFWDALSSRLRGQKLYRPACSIGALALSLRVLAARRSADGGGPWTAPLLLVADACAGAALHERSAPTEPDVEAVQQALRDRLAGPTGDASKPEERAASAPGEPFQQTLQRAHTLLQAPEL